MSHDLPPQTRLQPTVRQINGRELGRRVALRARGFALTTPRTRKQPQYMRSGPALVLILDVLYEGIDDLACTRGILRTETATVERRSRSVASDREVRTINTRREMITATVCRNAYLNETGHLVVFVYNMAFGV